MIPTSTYAVIAIFFGFALLELWRSNFLHKPEQTRDDAVVEVVGSVVLLGFTQPLIVLVRMRWPGSTCSPRSRCSSCSMT
jgi:hypothetical protein